MIRPEEHHENQSWILFYLNERPIFTEQDGDFNALAIMDVATGLIHGMQMEPLNAKLSDFEARLLLKQAESKAHRLAESVYITDEVETKNLVGAAQSLGVKIVRVAYDQIYPIIAEAVTGFTNHVSE